MKRTPRGFALYTDFTDTEGYRVRVQKSSLATAARVWIFCNDKDGNDGVVHLGTWQSYSPHLSKAQARRVAKALLRFADGED